VGVPGSRPNPTRAPSAGRPARYCSTKVRFAIAIRGTTMTLPSGATRWSRSSKSRPWITRIPIVAKKPGLTPLL
jgi:hypothetical protein